MLGTELDAEFHGGFISPLCNTVYFLCATLWLNLSLELQVSLSLGQCLLEFLYFFCVNRCNHPDQKILCGIKHKKMDEVGSSIFHYLRLGADGNNIKFDWGAKKMCFLTV